jgi:hypothetical protein
MIVCSRVCKYILHVHRVQVSRARAIVCIVKIETASTCNPVATAHQFTPAPGQDGQPSPRPSSPAAALTSTPPPRSAGAGATPKPPYLSMSSSMVMSPKPARRCVSPQHPPVHLSSASAEGARACDRARSRIRATAFTPASACPPSLSWAAPRTARHGMERQPPLTTGSQTRPSLASPLCSLLHLSALSAMPLGPLRTFPHRHAPPRHRPRKSAAIPRRNQACSSCESYKYTDCLPRAKLGIFSIEYSADCRPRPRPQTRVRV